MTDDPVVAAWKRLAQRELLAADLPETGRPALKGVYVADEAECRSRRVDLRTALDEDPGPLPMLDADEVAGDPDAVVLDLSGEE